MSTQATAQQCHIASGRLVQQAGVMDIMMCNAIMHINKITIDQAKAILFAADGGHVRKEMLQRSVKLLNNKEATEHTIALCEATRKVYKKRNMLAHAIIRSRPKDSGVALEIHSSKTDHRQPLTVEYLDDIIQTSAAYLIKGNGAYQKLCETLKVSPSLDF